MKLINVQFSGLENFDKDIIIDFYAEDKIIGDDNVSLVSKPIYSQNVLSFVGINATGKTTILRLLDMVINIVANNYGLDQISKETKDLFLDNSKMRVVFFLDNNYYLLVSTFTRKDNELIFKNEELSSFSSKEIRYKKQIPLLQIKNNCVNRKDFVFEVKGGVSFAIKDSDSIVSSVTSKVSIPYVSLINTTNKNALTKDESINPYVLKLFDRGIENAFIEDDDLFVKFAWKDTPESIKLNDADLLLSSGTIKGNKLFTKIANVMHRGGYLIVDEIENHMNKKYVQLILNIFQDSEINKYGATLIYSTHYIEILDSINRKDSIYVTKKDFKGKCALVKYSDVVNRNDIKKAEILLSNSIEGTAPYYEDIQRYKDMMLCKIKND